MNRLMSCGAALTVARLVCVPFACDAAETGVPILRIAKQWTDPARDCGGTIWRYYEAWQTDVVRAEGGALVPVEPYVYRQKVKGGNDRSGPFEIVPAKKTVGSALPPEDWMTPGFDDSTWSRQPGPFDSHYRSTALICVRGRFEVLDPAKITTLNLELNFQGGAVAYINGREVGREGMPAGKITPETLANDYPKEADWRFERMVSGKVTDPPQSEKDDLEKRGNRARTLKISIPPGMLNKGANVLAVEVHRAPAHPIMFTAYYYGLHELPNWAWNRCSIEGITLTSSAPETAIVPNVKRPKGMQVWNCSTFSLLNPTWFGDPNEPLRPIELVGLRNGTYAEQIVVSSPDPIKELKVSLSDLKGSASAIPSDALKVAYVKWQLYTGPDWAGVHAQFDPLEPDCPRMISNEIPATKVPYQSKGPYKATAFQPVVVSVKIPRDAKKGEYSGTLTITAAGEKAVEVPVKVNVASEWTLPEPLDFRTFIGMMECPDSVALQYGVPMWSEAHWKLLDQVFALMAEVGVGDLYIPLLAKTNIGNEESMVRWIKQPDGTYKPDFSIVERVLNVATKHLRKKLQVVFWIHDRPFSRTPAVEYRWAGQRRTVVGDWPLPCTEIDPATGKTKEFQAPQWGTPEARVFWKPVITGLTALMGKCGPEKRMLFGAGAGWLDPKSMEDCRALAPDVLWYQRVHHVFESKNIGYLNWGDWPVAGADVMSVNVDPDQIADNSAYLWRKTVGADSLVVTAGAWTMHQGTLPPVYRMAAETIQLHVGGKIRIGIGAQGADYWPVLPMPDRLKDGSEWRTSILERYTYAQGIDHGGGTYAFVGPGRSGPVPTMNLVLLKESLQDLEARAFVQDALLDHADKLGPDLAKRCKELCDDRTRQLRHYSSYFWDGYQRTFPNCIFNEDWYVRNTRQLYELTGEVAKALGR